jgi:sulfonate transport system substrate-binding protein
MLATTAALKNKAKSAAISDFTARLIKAENWIKTHQSTYVNDYYVNLFHLTTAEAQLILKAGGTYKYVALNGSEINALQNVVDLLGNAGAIPNSFNVAPLFSAAVSARYNAILKTHPQVG